MGQTQSSSRRRQRQVNTWCTTQIREGESCIRAIKGATFAELVSTSTNNLGPRARRAARCADLSSPRWYAQKYARNKAGLKRELLASQRESQAHTKDKCRRGLVDLKNYRFNKRRRPKTLFSMFY
jgi:hypothetical protein